ILAADEDKNLTPKQREYAETVYSAGRDLLALISQILDLSRVEAGRIETHPEPASVATVRAFVERTFAPVALQRGIGFSIDIAADTPATITADRHLLEEILKNLVSNAFKFTEHGSVALRVARRPPDPKSRSAALRGAPAMVAFEVIDTGIGIPIDKQEIIFEA